MMDIVYCNKVDKFIDKECSNSERKVTIMAILANAIRNTVSVSQLIKDLREKFLKK